MILFVENLSKSFDGIKAVDNVTFSLNEGEITSIIGPNGAGKSTLFNLLTGYLRKDAGKVIFKGEDISDLAPYQVWGKKIGRSFQIINIFQRMTVFENIQTALLTGSGMGLSFFTRAKNGMHKEAEKLLNELELSEKATVLASDLSYGDQRKLEIGLALGNSPELIFLDEPCAGLTSYETGYLVELIKRIANERGLTVLLVEHKMDVIFSISDKIRVLHEGRIIFEGLPEEVKVSEKVLKVYLGDPDNEEIAQY